MKLYVTVEEFLYAKKIENQTERTLRGYNNALNLFAKWLEKEWTIDELEKIRVVHLKQYVAYHLKMEYKATYRHMWTRQKRWMQSRKSLMVGFEWISPERWGILGVFRENRVSGRDGRCRSIISPS